MRRPPPPLSCTYCGTIFERTTSAIRFCSSACYIKGKTTIAENGCWEWQGAKNQFGHGQGKYLGLNSVAHRISYATFTGPIPDGLLIRHKCDNPPCCNPAHLETGTHLDNMRDKMVRGRYVAPRQKRAPENAIKAALARMTKLLSQRD